MELRRLTSKDLDSYFANRLRALQNAPSAFLTTYEEEKAGGNVFFKETLAHDGNQKAIFGAVVDGVVVGTIGIYREERPKVSHKAMIWGMYVDTKHRNKKIAGKLLDLAIDFAKNDMKVEVVGLSVESGNESAKQLYESRGFKTWGVEPKAMKSGTDFFDEVHMVLYL
ncbi:MAG: GNAT family N-acetyltransferase [Bdellovibrionales bacterium]